MCCPRFELAARCASGSAGVQGTRLYTRSGDRGETGLLGGSRIAKDSPRIRAFGSLDELGAHLGRVASELPATRPDLSAILLRLQHELFVAQAELAAPTGSSVPTPRIAPRHVLAIERDIDRLAATFTPVETFVLPRGVRAAAELHVARTVCRRAERDLWALHVNEPVPEELLQWANRLSGLLFAMGLSLNQSEGFSETPPDYTV